MKPRAKKGKGARVVWAGKVKKDIAIKAASKASKATPKMNKSQLLEHLLYDYISV